MTTTNDITGDLIKTKGTSDAYRDNYDLIFGKKKSSPAIIIDQLKVFEEECQKIQEILDDVSTECEQELRYRKEQDVVREDQQQVPFDKYPSITKGYDGKSDKGI